MSDAAQPVDADSIPAIPLSRLYPPEGAWERISHFLRSGWRPASAWACVAVLSVNGVALPLARLHWATLEPLDWAGMTPFATMLMGHAVLRTVEKVLGVSL